ncbi:MAG: hypothetical protein R2911_13000 [Caldilineaceae bacterium]
MLKPGGRGIIFAPNRFHPFETHGHYWRGQYHFGNTPLINYLPDPLRNRLAPTCAPIRPTGGSAPAILRPARAHCASHANFSGLRQHCAEAAYARAHFTQWHLFAGKFVFDHIGQ